MPWYRCPAFSAARVAFIVVLAIVTLLEVHEALR